MTDIGTTTDAGTVAASIEAVLMVVDEPVEEVTLAQVLEVPREVVRSTLEALADEYTATGRGFELRNIGGGWRYYTRPEQAAVVERFVLDGQQAKLTQAALETLAVVASIWDTCAIIPSATLSLASSVCRASMFSTPWVGMPSVCPRRTPPFSMARIRPSGPMRTSPTCVPS